MPQINLDTVNISIEQFQAVSSGKYNAGEVKLTGQNSIGKINNHVSRTGKNEVTMSHAEVLAIKRAFVDALIENGVGTIEINKVRTQLGLAPESGTDLGLKARSIRPLSRQQIREILDRNAETINLATGADTIRTSEELQARVTDRTKAARAATRGATNAALDAARELDANHDVELAQAVVAGDVGFRSTEDRRQILRIAEDQLESLRVACYDQPSEEKPAHVTYTMPTGQKVIMDTGMSEAAFYSRLEDMILHLKCVPDGPLERVVEARAEFKALETDAARKQWAGRLSHDPAGGFKARTAAVVLMYERGIRDGDTLDIPNNLPDDKARDFLANLLGESKELTGDALRQSLSVRSAKAQARPGGANEGFSTFLPAFTTEGYNEAIAVAFTRSRDRLPARFLSLALEVGHEVRGRFGEKGYTENPAHFDAFFSNYSVDLVNRAAGAGNRITPEALRAPLLAEAIRTTAERFLRASVNQRLPEDLRRSVGMGVGNALLNRHPELMQRLTAVTSARQAEEIMHEYDARIADYARIAARCNTARAGIVERMRASLAEKMGVPLSSLATVRLSPVVIKAKAARLGEAITSGKKGDMDDARIEAAFQDLADSFAEDFITAFRRIDALDVPPAAKDQLKEDLLLNENPGLVNIGNIVGPAKAISTAALEARLDANAPMNEIVDQLNAVVRQATDIARQYFAEDIRNGKDLGENEKAIVREMALSIVAHSNPSLTPKLLAFLDRPEVRESTEEAILFCNHLLPEPDANARLAAKLGKPDLPPLAAQALLNAVRTEGLDMLSRDEALALFAEDKKAGETLKIVLQDMRDPVGPSTLEILARGAVRSAKAEVLQALDEARQVDAAAQAFLQGEGAQRALAAGYVRAELPWLARIAAFHQVATGCGPAEAVTAALDPQSRARRLQQYGGRFIANAANYRNGLALLDRFAAWYQNLCADAAAQKEDTPTLLNANLTKIKPDALRAYEKFVFEEIAVNRSLNLAAEDPEKVFGMEANTAMRFAGRNHTQSFTNSLAQIPPEKRQLLYAVFDVMDPLMKSPADRATYRRFDLNVTLATRVLKNYDAVDALRKAGTLDREHIIPLLFSDFGIPANATNLEFYNTYTSLVYGMATNELRGRHDLLGPVQLLIESSGATKAECLDAVLHGRSIPPAPYVSSFNGEISELDGTAQGGRATFEGDVIRPSAPKFTADGALAIAPEDNRFTFHFPGEAEPMYGKTGNRETPGVREAAKAVADKIEALCGKVHQAQLSSVYFALSQSGLGPVNKSLLAHGVSTTEHATMTYTLSKDEETGAITIRYSEPKGFPFHFHWESTIQTDGSSTTTELVVEDPKSDAARASAADSAKLAGKEGEAIAPGDLVSGNGPAADAVRNLITTAAADAPVKTDEGKMEFIARRANEVAMQEMMIDLVIVVGKNFIEEENGVRTENFGAESTQFKRDLQGQMNIRLPGVDNVSRDYGTARDQMTKFVLDDPAATFANATAEQKKRVSLVMSFVSQYAQTSMAAAFKAGLARRNPPASLEHLGGGSENQFSLSKDADGNIRITLENRQKVSDFVIAEGNNAQMHAVPAGSHLTVNMDLTLPKENLDALVRADWSQFNHKTITESNHTLEQSAALIPKEIRFTGSVRVSGHIHIA